MCWNAIFMSLKFVPSHKSSFRGVVLFSQHFRICIALSKITAVPLKLLHTNTEFTAPRAPLLSCTLTLHIIVDLS